MPKQQPTNSPSLFLKQVSRAWCAFIPSATFVDIDMLTLSFSDQNVITILQNFALNKKSGWERESGAVAFQSLPAVIGPPSAPALLPSLPVLFDLLSDKGEVVRAAALAATKAILQLLPPEATRTVFGILEDILEKGKWQTKVGALDALKSFVARAKDSVADELGHILPKVEAAMHDTKKEVRF
jgi:elongation factor 3